jgi:beta-lactamase regulating signal transducer with metallopeptidase domain
MEILSLFEIVLQAGLRGAVLLALAGAAVLLMRRASAAQRHLVWALGVVGVLLLPVLAGVLPAWRVQVPGVAAFAVRPAVVASAAVESAGTPAEVADVRVGAASFNGSAVTTPSNVAPPDFATVSGKPAAAPSVNGQGGALGAAAAERDGVPERDSGMVRAGVSVLSFLRGNWPGAVLILWALGVLLLLVRGVAGVMCGWRMVRGAAPAGEGWPALATEAGTALGLRRAVRVLVSGRVAVPIVCGVFRPCLLLPAEADDWPAERRRAVLLHELAHVRRGDAAMQWLAQLACALHWPNPLVWLAAYRLRVEREAA